MYVHITHKQTQTYIQFSLDKAELRRGYNIYIIFDKKYAISLNSCFRSKLFHFLNNVGLSSIESAQINGDND